MKSKRIGAGILTGALVCSVLAAPPIAAAVGDAAAATSSTVAQSVSAQPSVYWGAYLGARPEDSQALDTFEQLANKRMAIIQWGQPWWRRGAYEPFQTSYFQRIRDRGAIPLLDWAAWDTCCGSEQPQFQLRSIVLGSHDAYLTQWARAAKAWGHPFFLRLNPEMNGWWSPWSEQANGNVAGDSIAAWQHIVDLFRAQGATNVTWVWCPNIEGQYSTPLDQLYPGDDYVDWTCMDGYNWGTDRNNSWQTFRQVFSGSNYNGGRDTYNDLLSLAPSKPIMIGETASSENGGSKAPWITQALATDLLTRFPQVKALLWFNWNANDPTLGWNIDSSPEAQAAFAEAIGLPAYAANDYRSLSVSPIPPPDALVTASNDQAP
ncbi:MAG: hypothetical protein M3069_24515 [Chloroflexota bacterium]|nr:hypothetical protein [Chloroflexota bacterium]